MRYDDDAPREFEFTHSKHTNHLIWSTQRSTHRTAHIKKRQGGDDERERESRVEPTVWGPESESIWHITNKHSIHDTSYGNPIFFWCVSDSLYRNVSHFYEHLSFFPMVLDSQIASFSPALSSSPFHHIYSHSLVSFSLSLWFIYNIRSEFCFQLELIFEQSTTHNNIPVCFVAALCGPKQRALYSTRCVKRAKRHNIEDFRWSPRERADDWPRSLRKRFVIFWQTSFYYAWLCAPNHLTTLFEIHGNFEHVFTYLEWEWGGWRGKVNISSMHTLGDWRLWGKLHCEKEKEGKKGIWWDVLTWNLCLCTLDMLRWRRWLVNGKLSRAHTFRWEESWVQFTNKNNNNSMLPFSSFLLAPLVALTHSLALCRLWRSCAEHASRRLSVAAAARRVCRSRRLDDARERLIGVPWNWLAINLRARGNIN